MDAIEEQVRRKLPRSFTDLVHKFKDEDKRLRQNFYIFANYGKSYAVQTVSNIESGKVEIVFYQVIEKYQKSGDRTDHVGSEEMKLREINRETMLEFKGTDFKI